ncbi:Lar family restriction alleviation protein [Pectinatus frisingensis]|uniref:Lar family restriction alleviation protein n=1 Tax=Pectinatus frisingensis TaxID=865 RepID=UPI0018C45AC0|nr:Lar family restriction alleviation protein [Pectinatus frisingensis]
MSDKLKPCPFCGGTPNIHDDDNKHPEFGKEIFWQIYCMDCFGTNGWFDSVDDAITAWNRRADNEKKQ